MNVNRLLLSILLLITALFSAACTTDDPKVIADCFWSATAVAFLDANENETFDEGESPLEGIEFVLEPSAFSRAVSGSDGNAYIFATTPAGSNISCEQIRAENTLKVTAVKYEGYQLTTPQFIEYTTEGVEYHFGFKQETAETAPAP